MPQNLSSKEASLFRQVIRNYEDKQYKKGLKAAEQILKKNPKHGDTLAMKALIMNSQGKTDEAFALAKVALQCDMKSHVCWHVYGLLYRAVKNFEEAIKAYKFALRLEPDSVQIQRDLALLQVQMRDYPGYLVSRKAMLTARSHSRQNWTALAVALHLNGELGEAESVLTTYEETLKHSPSSLDFEHSEAVLYKNSLIHEQGDIHRALDHLEGDGKRNLDRLAVMELRAKYLTILQRKEEAAKAYHALIDRNPEYHEYYSDLIQAMSIDANDHQALKAVYDQYAEKYPRCDAARRLPLDFLDGDEFQKAAEKYVHGMLDKGVPSTFANLKHLYSNTFKMKTLLMIVTQYNEGGNKNAGEEHNKNGDASRGNGAALYYLAQHYNYHLSRDLSKALEHIEKAIAEEPTSVEYQLTKARIWKHCGNTQKASEIMEHARTLDTRDRYINSKAGKYQLRNNENEAALSTMGMFTRAETVGGPLADLNDMQCMWFLTEDGDSYARQGKLGLALKRYTAIHNIFDVWQEDQFDFHQFSLRKGQIRAYVDMIRWEDQLRDHPFYTRTALAAIDVYIKLHGKPLVNGVNGDVNGSAEGATERKKAAKKARKDAQKAEIEAAAKKAELSIPTKDLDGDVKKKDDDPEGSKLAATTKPLEDAMKFLSPILQFTPKNIDAQLSGFEIYIRRKKYILALKCLLATAVLESDHPKLHEQIVRFKMAMDSHLQTLPEESGAIIKSEFNLISSSTLEKYNDDFHNKHKNSARHTLSFLRVKRLLSPVSASQCEQGVVETLELPLTTLIEAQEGLELLRSWRSSQVDSFCSTAASKWPEASAFASPSN